MQHPNPQPNPVVITIQRIRIRIIKQQYHNNNNNSHNKGLHPGPIHWVDPDQVLMGKPPPSNHDNNERPLTPNSKPLTSGYYKTH